MGKRGYFLSEKDRLIDLISEVENQDVSDSSPPQSTTALHMLKSQAEWPTTAISFSGRFLTKSTRKQ